MSRKSQVASRKSQVKQRNKNEGQRPTAKGKHEEKEEKERKWKGKDKKQSQSRIEEIPNVHWLQLKPTWGLLAMAILSAFLVFFFFLICRFIDG